MKQELADLKEKHPDMPHNERFVALPFSSYSNPLIICVLLIGSRLQRVTGVNPSRTLRTTSSRLLWWLGTVSSIIAVSSQVHSKCLKETHACGALIVPCLLLLCVSDHPPVLPSITYRFYCSLSAECFRYSPSSSYNFDSVFLGPALLNLLC